MIAAAMHDPISYLQALILGLTQGSPSPSRSPASATA